MKRGYYLWDWYKTGTIKFDSDIEFHCDEYAQTQCAYRRFADAKAAGIAAIEYDIEIAQNRLELLKTLTIKDVKP
jgi:hypothetical protein